MKYLPQLTTLMHAKFMYVEIVCSPSTFRDDHLGADLMELTPQLSVAQLHVDAGQGVGETRCDRWKLLTEWEHR